MASHFGMYVMAIESIDILLMLPNSNKQVSVAVKIDHFTKS